MLKHLGHKKERNILVHVYLGDILLFWMVGANLFGHRLYGEVVCLLEQRQVAGSIVLLQEDRH